jgi:hypothetical protein
MKNSLSLWFLVPLEHTNYTTLLAVFLLFSSLSGVLSFAFGVTQVISGVHTPNA